MVLAEFAVVVLLPTAIGGAVLYGTRALRWLAGRRGRPAPAEPAGQLAARLRRLRSELEHTECQHGMIAKQHHLRALRGAYADTLHAACERTGVVPPDGGMAASQAEIYRAEAQLRQRGVDVREGAAR
ncbi:MAG TPA: hypothetical protein VGI64_08950 [Streptosporangiaceae bacterium]